VDQDNIFRTGMTILDERGVYEQRDGVRISFVYEDEKIHIEALLPLERGGAIESFHIAVKKLDNESPVQPFGIPKSPPERETPVFVWKGIPRYHRPGRWEAYLDGLLTSIRKEDENVDALNGHPIDDADLFPDIPS
jgi:hypothetical protein